MALKINLSTLTREEKEILLEKVCFTPKKDVYCPNPCPVSCCESKGNYLYFPLGMWTKIYTSFPEFDFPKIQYHSRIKLLTSETDPKQLSRDQNVLVEQVSKRLEQKRSVLISAFPGYGKTTIGAFFIHKLGLKCAIICHVDIVKKQWVECVKDMLGANVCLYKKGLKTDCDVCVMGVQQASNIDLDFAKSFGFVIFDEVHIATLTAFTSSLLKFTPNYLMALSATPDRRDGLHHLFRPFFGSPKHFVCRSPVKKLKIIKYQTGIVPKTRYITVLGKRALDWNYLVNDLAVNEERHHQILKIVQENPREYITLFSGRVVQSKALFELLKKNGEDVDIFIGSTKIWRKDARVLIVGIKKGGVGMNDELRTMCLLASDVTDVRQLEGRIRGKFCLIYDMVDRQNSLENHWKKREKWYKKCKGEIIVKNSKNKNLKSDSNLSNEVISTKRMIKKS